MKLAHTDSAAPRARLHDRLTAELRRVIVTGAIADGARIPGIELCMRFGVSRTPLREALKSMSVEGLITLRPNRGSVVTPLDRDGVRQVFEVKGVLESFIGRAATERAGDADLAAVTRIHQRLAEAAGAGDA